ncbi:MAG: hypothetical protein JNK77_06290 [Saprospiraceae bacterium]|nr:hypothetical protein [Saprospiraceae bacterium]
MKKVFTLFFATLYGITTFGQWSTTNLSEGKTSMGAVAYGSKVWFGGGATDTNATDKVEIYDLVTGVWDLEELSVAREFVAAGAAGGKVLFAGGINFFTFEHYSRVDIFDTLTHARTTTELPEQKFDVAAIGYGNQVFFAGGANLATGEFSAAVDIYNTVTGAWTTASLSEPGVVRAVASGSKLIFVGAAVMDIYDAATGIWTAQSLPDPKLFSGVALAENHVYIAGGMHFDNTPTDRVDIYDLDTGAWTISTLSESRAFLNNAATACGKVFFAGGGSFDLNNNAWTSASNRVDVFDTVTGEWASDELTHPLMNHVVAANGDYVLVAGGWDLVSPSSFSTVEIYHCTTTGLVGPPSQVLRVSPNPTQDVAKIDLNDQLRGDCFVTLSDAFGRILYNGKLHDEGNPYYTIDLSGLQDGWYVVNLHNEAGSVCSKILKIAGL